MGCNQQKCAHSPLVPRTDYSSLSRHDTLNIITIAITSVPLYFFLFFCHFLPRSNWGLFVAHHLNRRQVQFSVNIPGKAKRLTSFERRSCAAAEARSRSRRRTTHVGCAHDRGMANKENELTCSGEVRGNCGLPVHSADASKMAKASSKYSDFTEVR